MPEFVSYRGVDKELLLKLADNENDPNAQWELGIRFSEGTLGLQKNPMKSMDYFQLAAANGHVGAQYRIQHECNPLLHQGNFQKAAEIYQKVAKAAESRNDTMYQHYMQKIKQLKLRAEQSGDRSQAVAIQQMYDKKEVINSKDTCNRFKKEVTKIKGFSEEMPFITAQLISKLRERKGQLIPDKQRLLEGLSVALKDSRLDLNDETTKKVIIALCQEICNMKRNSYDPRSPQSAKDFQLMLKDHKLGHLSPSEIKFDKQELHKLLRNPEHLAMNMASLIEGRVENANKPNSPAAR